MKKKLINGVLNTLHPSKGKGLSETIIACFLIVGFFLLIIIGKQIPDVLTVALSAIIGFFFGLKAVKNA